ncbi:MAG: hypothetical protein JO182_25045 [Acidobacteriaceae bacterium]|nr:hypothetical protein [Acidobacteriaceae bacterium]
MRFWGLALIAGLISWCQLASAQSWQPLLHQPNFNASNTLLLTDGTVICQASGSSLWFRLTPDAFGSYVNGTWTPIASLPPGYGPLYYASAVLPDGRVVIQGGEYNLGGPQVWTNEGAIYDPQANIWTPLPSPPGWTSVGDAQSIVLADGKFMLANALTQQTALLDPVTLTYTPLLGSNKSDRNDEEGWTLLPDGTVLAVDAISAPNSERYFPSLDTWMSAGSTIVRLEDPVSQEIGPAVLRPDGTVFATGACQSSQRVCVTPGHTAIYTPPTGLSVTGIWIAGPDFPDGLDVADGPAALLPNGNVLVAASPGIFLSGTRFFEWDGTSLNEVPRTPRAPSEPSYVGRMLILPTGQILYTDSSRDAEVYTPAGAANPSWVPTITDVPLLVNPGSTYTISGTQFNGLSQGAAYGDDAQSATNYPLVRITNRVTGHAFYCRTHDHSTMAVATGSAPVSTSFDVPALAESGISDLVVVANGIASQPRVVVVGPAPGIPDN